MAEISCLWVVTMRNIVGISLEELKGWGKVAVDWKSISPLPYDFHGKLPEEGMTPFVHDSKLFLAGGLIHHQPPHHALSSKIYQVFFDKDGDDRKEPATVGKKPLTALRMIGYVLQPKPSPNPPPVIKKKLSIQLISGATKKKSSAQQMLGPSPGPVPRSATALPPSTITNNLGIRQILEAPPDPIRRFLLRISVAAPDSIPPPPTALPHSYIANIGGKVYLLVYDARRKFRMVKREEGFWVLGSGGKEWQALRGPPPMYLDGFGRSHAFFVLQDKLFLEASNVREGNYYLYAFDTQTNEWYQLDDKIKKSFSFLEDERGILFPSIMVASLQLPDNNRNWNCTRVTLSWTWERLEESQVRVKIYAMLLNNQDHSVVRYQSLDEVSEAIQPSSFTDYTTRLNFVDLGNGLVCALVNGFPPEHDHGTTPVLCVLVFALSFAPHQAGHAQRFLDVDVRVNRVFTLAKIRGRNFREDLEHAFIFP